VYRLLKAHDLIASPAYIVIKTAEAFKDKTTAPILLEHSTCPGISNARSRLRDLGLLPPGVSRNGRCTAATS
jgi:hypothetical protein